MINVCSLKDLHLEVLKTFNPLPVDLISTIYEIGKRVLLLCAAVVAYPVLGMGYLISQSCHTISTLFGEKRPLSQEEKAKAARSAQLDDPQKELTRLRYSGGLSHFEEKKLDDSIRHLQCNIQDANSLQIKVIFAQALEIQKIYQNTHFVFLHSQCSSWLPITYMLKELKRLHEPQLNISHFKFLRADFSTEKPGFVEQIQRFFNPGEGIDRYQHRNFCWNADPSVMEQLLSCDASFFNHTSSGSAMYFLACNSNASNDLTIIKNIGIKILNKYYSNQKKERIEGAMDRILNTRPKQQLTGNLFLVCIPKEQKVDYRSHPYGIPCKCHPKSEDLTILQTLQNGSFAPSINCNSPGYTGIPQYRVFTSDLKPGTSQHIYLLTPLKKSQRSVMKTSIHKTLEDLKLVS
jgi:hypothetical protein